MSHTEGNDLVGSNSEPAGGQLKSAQPPHNNRPDNQPKCVKGFCSSAPKPGSKYCARHSKLFDPLPDNQADLLEAFRKDFNHIGDGRILVEPQELADYILAYTANKQIDLLLKLKQEIAMHTVPEGKHLITRSYLNNSIDFMVADFKNKKESL